MSEHQLWQVMARETAPLSLRLEEPCLCSVTYYDGEYREREVDAEAQKTVRGDYPDTEHVRFRTLPAVTFASATFLGALRQDPRGQRRRGRLGAGQRLCL